ncbi:hypothetical protein FOA52_015244 [Chlamydomonas sp. UWO 241]|nr:hypothetical protein FOA52_015244 [Chlamydomonas sp. UWO 241]
MLTKFETKSNRVKGLSFHPKRPWILAALHSGVVQLWDYRMGTLIDRFDEHDGPVRGVHFHKSQPLFVSGGDDYKIKVWNYKLRRCLFTLLGHLDYIRTVEFHSESPWIVSASDDQTIRIWNWQSRTCIAVLTGHNHYVMCARFHIKEDLVVSGSLDQTVRVWDISGLKKSSSPGMPDMLKAPQLNTDLFGGGDAVVKYVLEGHDRGVNWASFHPSLPLIVSGADDRQVKLWRYNESKAWEVDTLRGHTNNVSCVLFHARQDLIVSNSEDKSVRVWDMSKRAGVQTFRREHDRFWIMAGHPEINLLAAGHDGGMIVFKLERERPAYSTHQGTLYYVKDRYLRTYDFATQRDNPLISVRRTGSAGANQGPKTLSYNPAENALLITSDIDGGSYELYIVPKETARGDTAPEAKRGLGTSAVFIARNRFAVLDRASNTIQIRNLQNEITKKCAPPNAGATDAVFYAGTGMLLCRSEDKVTLFDVQQRTVLAELATPYVKYVVWNADMSQVALLSKHAIIIADKKLQNAQTVHETIRVKSAAWDDNGVLVYTTLNHVKYCLPNGDSGIIRTLEVPVYITRVANEVLHVLDRDGKNRQMQVDTTEYMFKLALLQRKYDLVISMIKGSALCGQAIISYLQQKGYPEVALHFVKDERTRFNLAVQCGNIEVALQSAQALDDKDTWYRLGIEALRQGNHHIVEFSYQKTKSFDRLSFLYLITGNLEKLRKMLKLSEIRGDVVGRFHNALYLGDVKEQVRVLEESGQLPLAYVAASQHGLTEAATRIAAALEGALPEHALVGAGQLLLPPAPILKEDNWPLLTVSKGFFEVLAAKGRSEDASKAEASGTGQLEEGAMDGAGWGDDNLDLGGDGGGGGEEGGGDGEEEGGWDMEDLEISPEVMAEAASAAAGGGAAGPFAAPAPGKPASQTWLDKRSQLAAEHAAAGAFQSAMSLLHRQLGATDFEPLRPYFTDLAAASHCSLPGMPGAPSFVCHLDRAFNGDAATNPPTAPALLYTLKQLEESLKAAYKLVTEGKFTDALKAFTRMLHVIPLTVVDTRKEVDEIKELLVVCREYHIALRCELRRKELGAGDVAAAMELAAFFTHCNLQPVHLALSLRSAMTVFFKHNNKATCSSFCRRLLELNPGPKIAEQVRGVLATCEKSPTDALKINYDPRNPFDICSSTFTPIFKGSKYVEDAYTGARFQPECAGTLSPLGDFVKIGADASGLLVSATQVR